MRNYRLSMVVLVFTPGYQRQYALAEGPAELFKKVSQKIARKSPKTWMIYKTKLLLKR